MTLARSWCIEIAALHPLEERFEFDSSSKPSRSHEVEPFGERSVRHQILQAFDGHPCEVGRFSDREVARKPFDHLILAMESLGYDADLRPIVPTETHGTLGPAGASATLPRHGLPRVL
jgi:hypothetical protein